MAFNRFCAAAAAGEGARLRRRAPDARLHLRRRRRARARAALEAPAAVGGTYNVGGGSRASLADAIEEIGALFGAPLKVRHQAVAAGDVRDTAADTTRAARDLGFVARTSLAEGLAEQVAWALRPAAGSERAA